MRPVAFVKFDNHKPWLWSLLLLTVLAALWPVSDREPATPEARNGGAASRHHDPATGAGVAFSPIAGEAGTDESAPIGDLFPSQTWTPPPPPPIPQKPTAPPLPFTYGGSYTEGGDTKIFLMEGEQVYTARQGDTVKGTYRVEKIEPAAISLIYLPLGTPQTLPTGGLIP